MKHESKKLKDARSTLAWAEFNLKFFEGAVNKWRAFVQEIKRQNEKR